MSKRQGIEGQDPPHLLPPDGSHEEFCTVWTAHRPYLLRLSLRLMGGRRADAEDALSAVKLKAMARLAGGVLPLANERAWLVRLLYNACMDHYRRQRREEAKSEPFDDAEEIVAAGGMTSPEERVLDREQRLRIAQLLAELPPSWREALVERCLQRKTYEEIARAAGTTAANVRKRVQLARALLRRLLSS